ncbi:MAG: Gfo/Idh/MocA family oxidoreductase [Oscillospiraceae bacterium]|nr:Gfo/Idh/MocA family oxidoreductase [Oscillospiraceae bacterium]
MSGTDKTRVAIIGCGGIANGKHMPSLKRLKTVEMVGFCDIVLERAEKAKEQYGTPESKVYADYKQMLAELKPDVVQVLTPNASHSYITCDALEAGAHVMCEKPMAKTAAEARKMIETSKKTGKLLTIGYQNRFRADSTQMKKVCERGDLGEIYFAKAHAIRRRGVPTWGVFLKEEEQGGGPLIDIGTHALDLALWIMDNYEPAYAVGTAYKKFRNQTDTGNLFGDWNPDEFTVEDSAFGFVVMKNGATIFIESSWALNTLDVAEGQTTLCGTLGGADMRDGLRINKVDLGRQTTIRPNLSAGGVAFYEGSSNKAEDIEAAVWIAAVREGKELIVKPEQALVVTEILEAIYKSSESGNPVYF